MPNITSVLNDQIRRLAKREITANTKVVRRATVEYRHAIAALKRQVTDLTKRLAVVEKHAPKEVAVPPEVLEKGRFRAIGVKAHRAKLGLSAKDYGKLAGVASITIYQWESGKSTPRKAQKARWLAIRGLGKQEALQRLGMAEPKAAPIEAPATTPAGTFRGAAQAQRFILALLQGGKSLLTAQVNAAWKKAKRPGAANKTLELMVKAKRLRRTAVPGERGSLYFTGFKPRSAVTPAKSPATKPYKRGQFRQTGQELVLSLLKGRRVLTTSQLGAAWKQAGRGGTVDNVLGQLVKAKKLKRKPLGGMKGSEYQAA